MKPLLLLMAVLAFTISVELRLPSEHVKALPAPPERPSRRLDATPTVTHIVSAMSLVLGRPIFAPERRPPRSAAVGDGLPRLSGIVRGPLLSLAIFDARHEGGGSSSLPVGSELAGWRIARIDPSLVMLTRGNAVLRLRPSYITSGLPPPPPVSMASIVVLSSKHTNPQLAW